MGGGRRRGCCYTMMMLADSCIHKKLVKCSSLFGEKEREREGKRERGKEESPIKGPGDWMRRRVGDGWVVVWVAQRT